MIQKQEKWRDSMVSIIVAMDEKRGIGKSNTLMWHIPDDLKRFKQLTTGHPIIMGRKTFESIGRVLPNRTNIIITRDPSFTVPEAIITHSLEEAFRQAQDKPGADEIFVIGGGQIFKEAMEKSFVDKLYLTLVKGDFGADTFFPNYAEFTKVVFDQEGKSRVYEYKFVDLEK